MTSLVYVIKITIERVALHR